jgi:formylglycine-generating enzyme required for sulfatase activity
MGSPEREDGSHPDELPQHKVKISPFLMGKYLVTQAQWRVVASMPKIERDLNPEPSYYKGYSRRPVESISWYEAVEFCERLSHWSQEKGKGYQYRLPSESEWEYACRAVISYQSSVISEESSQNPIYPPYHFGWKIDPALANYAQTALARTTTVGRFQIANAFGLYDMHGNVFEWCLDDWHDHYEGAPIDGRAWLIEKHSQLKLLRGGSWVLGPGFCRCASRLRLNPDASSSDFGLRVVASSRT